MKRLTALLLAGMVALCGCDRIPTETDSIDEEAITVYRALPLPELHMEIPSRFAATSSDFYEEYYICEDASIIITQDTSNAPYGSVYDYAVSALAEYESITTELEMLHEELVYAGTIAVQTLEFNYTIGEGDGSISMTCMTGYMTDTDSMYIITCKSKRDTYEDFRSDFLSVITSARYLK